jgi:hypothetical protein
MRKPRKAPAQDQQDQQDQIDLAVTIIGDAERSPEWDALWRLLLGPLPPPPPPPPPAARSRRPRAPMLPDAREVVS